MKRMMGITTAVLTVAMALADGPAAVPVASAPAGANGAAPAVAAPGQPGAPAQVDVAKYQEVVREWQKVRMALMSFTTNIVANDPELKEMSAKQKEMVQKVDELGKAIREKMDAKLKADPAAAPLVAKRDELQAKLQEMYPAAGGPRMPGGPGMMRLEGNRPVPSGRLPPPKPETLPAPAPAAK